VTIVDTFHGAGGWAQAVESLRASVESSRGRTARDRARSRDGEHRNDRNDGHTHRVRDLRKAALPAFTLTEKARSWMRVHDGETLRKCR
jgi:hypothetical protein